MLFGCCVNVESLPLIQETGFDYAELQVRTVVPEASEEEWAKARDAIRATGVPVLGFNVLLPRHLRVVGPDIDYQALDSYLDVAFSRMSELGGKYLSFGSGGARRVPDGFDRSEGEKQLRKFIALLGQKGERFGLTVDVEFLNRKETNIILSLLEADEYVKAVNVPSVRLLADLYHIMEESEPIADLATVADHVGYVHVADTGRRHPGSGSYPYEEFVRTLKSIGYDGPVSVECGWGEDLAAEMRASSEYLRRVFA